MALARVILAIYLAIWSPAICCCTIKSAMGGTRCAAETLACCTPKSCCEETDDSRTASCCETVSIPCGEGSSSDQSKCRCHERTVDRLDTGVKVFALPLLPNAFASGLEAIATPIALPACTIRRVNSPGEWHPPPLQTLQSQHCLLQI